MPDQASVTASACLWFIDVDFVRAADHRTHALSDDAIVSAILDPENHDPFAPNVLFDAAHCRSALGPGEAADNVVLRYLRDGIGRGVSPNPVFDPNFYLLRRPRLPQNPAAAIKDCLACLKRNEPLPAVHPFFDEAFMRRSRDHGEPADFHMRLFQGEISEARTHALVDFDYLSDQLGCEFTSYRDVLAAYWASDEDVSTHIVFDLDFYRSQLGDDADVRRAVYHYLASDAKTSPQPLFDPAFYAAAAEETFGAAPSRPLEHYISDGQAAGIDPSPYFETDHYRALAGCGDAPLEHFLRGGHRNAPGHSLLRFSRARLYSAASGCQDTATESLLARRSLAAPADVMPEFDAINWKNRAKAELADEQDPAAIRDHYLRFGYPQDRAPNGLINPAYIAEQIAFIGDDNSTPMRGYFRRGWHLRPRVLFAVDDLADTAINRSLCDALRLQLGEPGLDVVVVTRAGGVLEPEFRRFAHVWHLRPRTAPGHDPHFENNLARLRTGLGGNPPEIAFIQADQDLHLIEWLKELSPRCVALSEAPPLSFDEDGAKPLSDGVDHILCRSVATNSGKHSAADGIGITYTQGYTPRAYAGGSPAPDPAGRDAVRARLGIADNAFVVVGCGSFDLADGLDIFGVVSARLHAEWAGDRDIRFIWVGNGPKYPNTPYFYANYFARLSGNSDLFMTVDDPDISPMLAASDVFLETSRGRSVRSAFSAARYMGLPAVSIWRAPAAPAAADGAPAAEAFDFSGVVAELARLADPDESGDAPLAAEISETGHALSFLDDLNACAQSVGLTAPFLSRLLFSPPQRVLVVAGAQVAEKLSALDIRPERRDKRGPLKFFARQITRSDLPMAIKGALHVNGATEYCVKLLSAALGPTDFAGFDTVIWLLDGAQTELADVYRLGNLAEEIWVTNDRLISEMAAINPNIASRMRYHEDLKPC